MTSGARSQPPDLPNFEYRSWLGGGGFADVFLYEQVRPRRQVAIKVLRQGALDSVGHEAFDIEANLMAKVSAHPYIVAIFGADIAPDGRPFIVMEYYPKPHFGVRSRGTGLPVQEVLRVGVRVASAIETAHRAQILHRDIKPANILVNEYDRPGLSDFGIAGERDVVGGPGGDGMTVAYGPPEVLGRGELGAETGDVYSLAATLYALLSGRAPFELPGADNSAKALLQRTLSEPVPPLAVQGLPRSLELLLAQAMAKDPAHRPGSAAALARSLQGIERELGLSVTDFELAGVDAEPLPARDDDDPDSTRAGRIQVVSPSKPPAPIHAPPSDLTQARGVGGRGASAPTPAMSEAPASETAVRQRATAPESVEAPGSSPGGLSAPRPAWLLPAAVVAAVLVVGLVASFSLGGAGDDPASSTTTTLADVLIVGDPARVPVEVAVDVVGTEVTVRWEAPDAMPGDRYVVTRTDVPDPALAELEITEPFVTVAEIDPSEDLCFTVQAVRPGEATLSPSTEGCADGE